MDLAADEEAASLRHAGIPEGTPTALPVSNEHSDGGDGDSDDSDLVHLHSSAVGFDQPASEKMPSSVLWITACEGSERFTFYSLRSVLPLYFHQVLRFSENKSTSLTHAFIMIAYLCPLLGGWLADTKWGKYRAIVVLTIVYMIGQVLLTLSAIAWPSLCFIALFLVAIGTGIKSSISAFVADQMPDASPERIMSAFALFYWSINVGSFLAYVIAPMLRQHASFAAAFAVPAALLAMSLSCLLAGSASYRKVAPGRTDVVADTCRILTHAVMRYYALPRARRPASVLDAVSGVYSHQQLDELRQVLLVLQMFLVFPVFWSLFDQHSSRWMFQAERMDRQLGAWTVLPDQISGIDPILLLFVLPLFDRVLFPTLRRRGYDLSQIARIGVGILATTSSFLVAALVQWRNSDPAHTLSIVWIVPQYALLVVGEILVSITALEFAYANSPERMKAVIMAVMMLTVSIGNALTAVVAAISPFHRQELEFLFFAFLMVCNYLLFLKLAQQFRRGTAQRASRMAARTASEGMHDTAQAEDDGEAATIIAAAAAADDDDDGDIDGTRGEGGHNGDGRLAGDDGDDGGDDDTVALLPEA